MSVRKKTKRAFASKGQALDEVRSVRRAQPSRKELYEIYDRIYYERTPYIVESRYNWDGSRKLTPPSFYS